MRHNERERESRYTKKNFHRPKSYSFIYTKTRSSRKYLPQFSDATCLQGDGVDVQCDISEAVR